MDALIKSSALEFDKISPSLTSLFKNPFGIHGLYHAKRVYILVCLLSEMENISEGERRLLKLAALYHDIGRRTDGECSKHGRYSVEKLMKYNLVDPTYDHLEALKFIIENHCIDDADAYINIKRYNFPDKERVLYLYAVLKDADGLDRLRVGDLDNRYLRTESAKALESTAYDLLKLYK